VASGWYLELSGWVVITVARTVVTVLTVANPDLGDVERRPPGHETKKTLSVDDVRQLQA